MWHRLLLLSLIQASLFSQAFARRIKALKKDKVTQDTLEVADDTGCPKADPAEDAAEANYQGTNGWLIVMCDHANGLKNTNWTGKADPFCQIELQDSSSGQMISKAVGLYKEDAVSGNAKQDLSIDLNEHVAFDIKSPTDLNRFKVKVSVRDDDGAFGNGMGTYNGGDLMGSKTMRLPPRGRESVKFFNHYNAIEKGKIGSWDWCPTHLCPKYESPGRYEFKPTQKVSNLTDIPGAWEIQGKSKFDDGSQGTVSYRIRWCPYTNFDEQETKRWRQVRGKGCVKEKTVYKSRNWVFNYAPACVIQGMRQFSKSAYCYGWSSTAKCSGHRPSRRTVRG